MQKVKALPYPRPPADCGWFYGPDYMVRISEEAVKNLCRREWPEYTKEI